jgi:hypothetical protein
MKYAVVKDNLAPLDRLVTLMPSAVKVILDKYRG